MPTCIPKQLKCFLLFVPKNPCYAPHKLTVTAYVQSTHYKKVPDANSSLDLKGTKDKKSKVR